MLGNTNQRQIHNIPSSPSNQQLNEFGVSINTGTNSRPTTPSSPLINKQYNNTATTPGSPYQQQQQQLLNVNTISHNKRLSGGIDITPPKRVEEDRSFHTLNDIASTLEQQEKLFGEMRGFQLHVLKSPTNEAFDQLVAKQSDLKNRLDMELRAMYILIKFHHFLIFLLISIFLQ